MIDPQDRFWIVSEAILGHAHIGTIIDWDQRRWYSVNSSLTLCPPEEAVEIGILKRHIDHLAQNVYSITVDNNGQLVTVSSAAADDPTLIPYYPRYSTANSLQGCPTITLSKLAELDRLGPGVDLVSYLDDLGAKREAVFKYSIISQWTSHIWKELHLIQYVAHPYIVPFDHVVIDDVESRVLGFTTAYVPGGSLAENKSRIFRLEWLRQLTSVADYLNLELGIMHQDIAPRNLLVDPVTNDLRLFDFDRSAIIGHPDCIPARNDIFGVIFTLYEIITHDQHFREVPFEEQDAEKILNLDIWPIRSKLDCDVGLFRTHLDDWVRGRREQRKFSDTQTATAPIDVPDMSPPTPRIVGYDEANEPIYKAKVVSRRSCAVKHKEHVVFWERPPYGEAATQ